VWKLIRCLRQQGFRRVRKNLWHDGHYYAALLPQHLKGWPAVKITYWSLPPR